MIVALVGSSSTAGRGQAFDWIGELKRRSGNQRFEFRNFGSGGDLAYNVLERLPAVLSCKPEKIVVWIGSNDVLALTIPAMRCFARLTKHLPCEPSPAWFRENLEKIAERLKTEATGRIALCSLAPIGENIASADPLQSELNRRIAEYSGIIRETAGQEGCAFVDIYQAMLEAIQASPGRAFTRMRFLPFYRDAFLAIALRRSPDDIAEKNGWRFHSDGIHLNSRGGMIVADCVQRFLDA
jgi:lysophospholipase L1-like esterase